jgi:hypothetical protein
MFLVQIPVDKLFYRNKVQDLKQGRLQDQILSLRREVAVPGKKILSWQASEMS